MPTASKSLPVLFSDAPWHGLVFDVARRLPTGSLKVDLQYNLDCRTGAAPGHKVEINEQGERLYMQKALFQSCSFKRAMIKEWPEKDKHGNQTGNKDKAKWDIDFSLSGHDNPYSEVKKFREWVDAGDANVKDTASKKALEWFRKPLKESTIEDYHIPMVKLSKPDPDAYPPTFKATLPFAKQRPQFFIFDRANKPRSFSDLLANCKGNEIVAIFELPSVWFGSNMFGMKPILRSVQYFAPDELTGYSFLPVEASPSQADHQYQTSVQDQMPVRQTPPDGAQLDLPEDQRMARAMMGHTEKKRPLEDTQEGDDVKTKQIKIEPDLGYSSSKASL